MGVGRIFERAKGVAHSSALTLVVGGLACATPGKGGDFTSVSVGKSNGGRVHRPHAMPMKGRGYLVPPTWKERGLKWGTDELVSMVERAAVHVRAKHRRATLGVGDLSPLRGGKSMWHKSHQSGRDVDLMFYSVDTRGRALGPPTVEMVHYDGKGRAYMPDHVEKRGGYEEPDWERRRFDDARNWDLVEALLSDSSVRLQWIFVSRGLEARLLRYARKKEKPRWLVAYAEMVLRQPAGSSPHDDHFHIRIYCNRRDRIRGCEDTGPVWQHEKKGWKYAGPERYDPVLWARMGVFRRLAVLGP